ncbi:Benzyl alcohol O-benzoyltransferase [Hibiscus syriacus]|uniref:Benzyl alcohol O-benzoyltransferase n=1 Tax=Hibiscus syriacus TaxID=106335 RepID=A0A6A3BU99_HIBSY|nr:Benzyl alcohol O-benzoyltransferase [Hibiscus syriacus]
MLSDIDDQDSHRFQIRGLHIYRCDDSMQEKDPVRVIRESLAKALVLYYPLAGRLKEGPNRKVIVDCTGEGVLFVEGDADVILEELDDSLHPPFPCFNELLYETPGSSELLNCPVLQIQFMFAVGEIARAAVAPSIPPVWERHLLNGGNPPVITCDHHEYDHATAAVGTIMPTNNLVHRSFFFGPTQISALKRFISDDLHCSRFDIVTACIWRCRTMALRLGHEEDFRLICIVNARSKFSPPLPLGYYGNALGYPAARTTAGKLSQNPLEYAVKLVKETKVKVTEEYMKSKVDLIVSRRRPNVNTVRSLLVSDLTRAGFREVDFGWGKAEFRGPANGEAIRSFYIPWKNKEGIAVPVCLPAPVMDSFVKEINRMLTDATAA